MFNVLLLLNFSETQLFKVKIKYISLYLTRYSRYGSGDMDHTKIIQSCLRHLQKCRKVIYIILNAHKSMIGILEKKHDYSFIQGFSAVSCDFFYFFACVFRECTRACVYSH